jgi:hypothetical protein
MREENLSLKTLSLCFLVTSYLVDPAKCMSRKSNNWFLVLYTQKNSPCRSRKIYMPPNIFWKTGNLMAKTGYSRVSARIFFRWPMDILDIPSHPLVRNGVMQPQLVPPRAIAPPAAVVQMAPSMSVFLKHVYLMFFHLGWQLSMCTNSLGLQV